MVNKTKLPGGVILMIVLFSIAILGKLISLFNGNEVLLGFEITFPFSIIISLVYLAIFILLIIGFSKLKYWSWVLALVYFIFQAFNSIMLAIFLRSGVFSLIGKPLMIASGVIGAIGSFLIIAYLLFKQDLFKGKKDKHKKADLVFVISYLVFFILSIFLTVGIAVYVGAGFVADQVGLIGEMEDLDFDEAKEMCMQKSGYSKDMCVFSVLITNANISKEEKVTLCNGSETEVGLSMCFMTAAGIDKDESYCTYLPDKDTAISCRAQVSQNPKVCEEISSKLLVRNCKDSIIDDSDFESIFEDFN